MGRDDRNTPTGVGKTEAELTIHGGEQETPPRAWGRHLLAGQLKILLGNTPTGVGKTHSASQDVHQKRKHPHGRGEDETGEGLVRWSTETPPRAWGRRMIARDFRVHIGNTPTGVGKTWPHPSAARHRQKHPHGRGEDFVVCLVLLVVQETPPRAWGRLTLKNHAAADGGNTPTGVGKTEHGLIKDRLSRKHPHGRGEDLFQLFAGSVQIRNTPTGVGKTSVRWWSVCTRKKHPHGRGEDSSISSAFSRWTETPPRAWGRLSFCCWKNFTLGNTPTGVGKTSPFLRAIRNREKHPHGRGEDLLLLGPLL